MTTSACGGSACIAGVSRDCGHSIFQLEGGATRSQTRRDTNFAIPGYSPFCHDTTASGKNKDFSVCGHLCGQSRFCAVFGNHGKSRKRRCYKALRRFALPCSGYRHGTPKCRALPVEPHPDIQFLPLYHGEGENQRFFCLWSFLWSKTLLCRFRQSGEIQQTQVLQGFAAFRLTLSRIPPRHSQSKRATNCATPGYFVILSGWSYSPKPSAIPTSLHPDIHFPAMIPRRGVKIKFFLSVVIPVVKAAFVPFSATGEIQQTQVSQGFAAFRLTLSRIQPRHSQTRRDTNFAIPGYNALL